MVGSHIAGTRPQVFCFDNTQPFHLVDSDLFDIYLESSGRCWFCFIGYYTTVSLTRWLKQHKCDVSERGSANVSGVGSFCRLRGAVIHPFSTLLYPLTALLGLQVGFLLCLHPVFLLCVATSVNESSLFTRTLTIWTYLDDLIWA